MKGKNHDFVVLNDPVVGSFGLDQSYTNIGEPWFRGTLKKPLLHYGSTSFGFSKGEVVAWRRP